jgi:hypothetical protein
VVLLFPTDAATSLRRLRCHRPFPKQYRDDRAMLLHADLRNGQRQSVACFGEIDMRVHAKVLSALRTDTPRSISAEAFGAED